jgi:hypothetical protein
MEILMKIVEPRFGQGLSEKIHPMYSMFERNLSSLWLKGPDIVVYAIHPPDHGFFFGFVCLSVPLIMCPALHGPPITFVM